MNVDPSAHQSGHGSSPVPCDLPEVLSVNPAEHLREPGIERGADRAQILRVGRVKGHADIHELGGDRVVDVSQD